jgi:anti-anti-sigma factor
MALEVQISDRNLATKHVALSGRLDTITSPGFDEQLGPVLASGTKVLVFDLAGLTYISSAGLRSVFKARKAMEARQGSVLLVNVQPSVQKVFDIVKALPSQSVFKSISELDQYLDYMQGKTRIERGVEHDAE